MDVRDLVRGYYGADAGLTATILRALSSAGVDVEDMSPAELFPVDHLHAGGAGATQHVLERLGVEPELRLLDVGSGVGGPARMAAVMGARVTGVDLTPEFVATARELSELVGLGERAEFVTAPAESLPFEDQSFDAAMMVHAGMNIANKQEVFADVHRVLTPGSRFAVYDQMATGAGEVRYPMPWAEDARASFLETVDAYTDHLKGVGFSVAEIEDRTESVLAPRPSASVGPGDVYGPVYVEGVGNYVAAARSGLVRAVLVVSTA
jgi:ubiquinone/menaquinone biosynthesis C-methylase UbiE